MQVTLTPEQEQIVQTYIDSGQYQNPSEVLLASLQLLQNVEMDFDMSFGTLDNRNQFISMTESEMVQESLEVLESYQNDGIPHNEVEIWAKNLGRKSN